LDFFAGTGTTAHAAHNLNIADGGTRRVILVEQNSKILETHLAHRYGYKFIADITEARLKYISRHDKNFKYDSFLMDGSVAESAGSLYGGSLAYG
jgi:adenine-specific DNA-methyltransferase